MVMTMAQLATMALNDPDRLGLMLAEQGFKAPSVTGTVQSAVAQGPMLAGPLPAGPPPPGTLPTQTVGPVPTPVAATAPPVMTPAVVQQAARATVPPAGAPPASTPAEAPATESSVGDLTDMLAGVSLQALQSGARQTPQAPLPPVRGGRPGPSQLDQIVQALLAGQNQPMVANSLGAALRGA